MALSFNFNNKQKSSSKTISKWKKSLSNNFVLKHPEKPKLDASQYDGKIWFNGGYWDINVLEKNDIINKIQYLKDEDKDKITSIVFNAELFCKETLLNECIAHFPYLGTFKINAGKRYLDKNENKIKELTKNMNNVEKRNVRIKFYKEGWTEFNRKQWNSNREEYLKKIFKDVYDDYYKYISKEYADWFIHSLTLLEFIPFDQAFEDAFQRLN